MEDRRTDSRNVEKPGKTSWDFRRAGRPRHLMFGVLRNLGYRCFQRRSDKAPEKRREISCPKEVTRQRDHWSVSLENGQGDLAPPPISDRPSQHRAEPV